MMQVFPVPLPLSQWVDGAVIIRMRPGQRESRFPAMPRAMLTMHLVRDPCNAWAIVQPATFHTLTTEPSVYTHAENITALGLIVRPAAAACLLQPVCGAVTDQVLAWSAFVGEPEAVRMQQKIERVASEQEVLEVLRRSFEQAMRDVPPGDWQRADQLCEAVTHLGAKAGDRLGIGRRQLERRCMSTLGVSPKQFERLERFHRALTSVITRDAASLAQESIDAGYFDQSHLALDARRLGGASVLDMKLQAAPGTPWWSLSTPRALQGTREQGASASEPQPLHQPDRTDHRDGQ